jgi:hypothetical protein
VSIQIKADFRNRGFVLMVNGEAIGAVYAQYKHAAIDRQWLIGELS